MRIVFEKSGTHIQHGWLKIGFCFYPDMSDRTWAQHYVDEVDKEERPTGRKQLNPSITVFIKIAADETRDSVRNHIRASFPFSFLKVLDDALADGSDEWKEPVRARVKSPTAQPEFIKPVTILEQLAAKVFYGTVNEKFADLEVRSGD